jgi:hypothetical protein
MSMFCKCLQSKLPLFPLPLNFATTFAEFLKRLPKWKYKLPLLDIALDVYIHRDGHTLLETCIGFSLIYACIMISGQSTKSMVCNGQRTDLFLVLSATAWAISKRTSGLLSIRFPLTQRSINSTV